MAMTLLGILLKGYWISATFKGTTAELNLKNLCYKHGSLTIIPHRLQPADGHLLTMSQLSGSVHFVEPPINNVKQTGFPFLLSDSLPIGRVLVELCPDWLCLPPLPLRPHWRRCGFAVL